MQDIHTDHRTIVRTSYSQLCLRPFRLPSLQVARSLVTRRTGRSQKSVRTRGSEQEWIQQRPGSDFSGRWNDSTVRRMRMVWRVAASCGHPSTAGVAPSTVGWVCVVTRPKTHSCLLIGLFGMQLSSVTSNIPGRGHPRTVEFTYAPRRASSMHQARRFLRNR